MGEVYEAVLHGASGFEKRLALKVIRSELVDQPVSSETAAARRDDFLSRFVEEAKLVSDLIHIHIVQIYLLGEVAPLENGGGGDAFIAMELVNGINLRSFIDRHLFEEKTVPIEIAVYIASRIARALEYAHTATDRDDHPLGIVHRDVSPTNILISVEGVVKLSDFGIAKAVRRDAQPEDYVAGKRKYMAPEQMASANVDFRADIYSLGLVLQEMLILRAAPSDLPRDKISIFRADVPPALEAIIRKATQRAPAERYASTSDFAIDLERFIYEKGYGPTFVTMAAYLKEIFPALLVDLPRAAAEDPTIILRK